MIKLYISGIMVCMDFSFFAVILFFYISGGNRYIIPSILACILHEIGHLLPIVILGEKVKSISFYGAGIKIYPEIKKIKSLFQDIVIMIGGPIINIVTGCLTYLLCENESLKIFAILNLCLGIFNLFPLLSLDGGTILLWLAEYNGKLSGEFILTVKVINVLFALSASAIIYFNNVVNFTAIVTILYIEVSDMIADVKGKSIT